MNTLIAYHKDCIDGFTSAWVTTRAMEAKGQTVELFAMEYKQASVDELMNIICESASITKLYVVDLSLDVDVLAMLSSMCATEVFILDHHKTAFEKYCPQVEVTPTAAWNGHIHGAHIVLDNNECGASLCWKVLGCAGTEVAALLIAYVKDYDLWRFERGDETKWVNKYLAAADKELTTWDLIAAEVYTDPRRVLVTGRKLQAAHDRECHAVADKAEFVNLLGHAGLSVVCPRELTSDVGHILATQSGTFGLLIRDTNSDHEITYSLRSNGDFDVSAMAKQLGGGGHKNAAGFMSAQLRGQHDE